VTVVVARVERAEQAEAIVGDDLVAGIEEGLAQVRRGRVLRTKSAMSGSEETKLYSGSERSAQPATRHCSGGNSV
jgi:hypothetical protein